MGGGGRVVLAAHGVLELVAQLPQGPAVHRLDGLVEGLVFGELAIHAGHPPVTVGIREPAMDAPTERIDQEAGGVLELRQGRQAPGEGEVAQDHLVARILPARPELGEPFGPPERQGHPPRARRMVVALRHQAQLEDVHQLVAQGMAELRQVAAERHGDAALQEIGRAQEAFRRDEREDVGLLEVHVRRVDDERDAGGDLVAEAERERVVALLGIGERGAREFLLDRIVVQVHVLALEHAPVEPAVLDLVLPELEELGGGGARGTRHENHRGRQCAPVHGATCGWCGSHPPA